MSSGMFRGKESLNRIELSRLVQDLLNFAVLGSLRLWGGGRWVGGCQGHLGAWGVSPHIRTRTHMHAHAHTHMYTCIEIATWPPTWRHAMFSMISMFNMHVCACVRVRACACVCAWDIPPHTHTHPHPHAPIHHPPRGWTPRISKNSITLELIKIFQFRLKDTTMQSC